MHSLRLSFIAFSALFAAAPLLAQQSDTRDPLVDSMALLRAVKYPKSALEKGVQDTILVYVQVDTKGKPLRVDVIGQAEELKNAAREATKRTRFAPALQEGKKVTGFVSFGLGFHLEDWQGTRVPTVRLVPVPQIAVATPELEDGSAVVQKREGDEGRRTVVQEKLPDRNEFVPVEEEATWDPSELQRRIRYPDAAIRAGIEGTVIVRVLVDKKGRVVKVVIEKSDNRVLEEAAVDAVKGMSFTPAKLGNQAVASWIQIDVNFRLDPPSSSNAQRWPSTVSDVQQRKSLSLPWYDPSELQRNLVRPAGVVGRYRTKHVLLRVLIDKEGKPFTVQVVRSEDKRLDNAAIDAARITSYLPARKDGNPISQWVEVPVEFKPEDRTTLPQDLPQEDEFVAFEREATWDRDDLARRIRVPEEARLRGVEGKVLVNVLVNQQGKAIKSQILSSSHTLFEEEARRVVEETSFTSASMNGKPVSTWVQIEVLFTLEQPSR